jgi:diguanylate cyclase (GGDEF)-like protein
MIAPLAPANEACRLAALHELNILDSPPEERFDRITRLARRLFHVPIALVSLVDADRQWFKSHAGIEATETPRAISFCGHVILRSDPMIVPDAALDVRFSDNPLVVEEPRIRFYAGCPLITLDGFAMGTLCIVDRAPRELGGEDIDTLKDLAGAVEEQLTQTQAAMVDALTGLTNRRGLVLVGDHLVEMAARSRIPMCALFFDLDGFKAINDVHGHAAGDRALLAFGHALVDAFRASDIVSRLGGDEFCVVMSDAREIDTHKVLERLDAALGRLGRGEPFEIEYSVGVTPFDPARHARIVDVLDGADRKMYVEKRSKHGPRT